MKKRIITALIGVAAAALMVAALGSCGKDNRNDPPKETAPVESTIAPAESQTEPAGAQTGSKNAQTEPVSETVGGDPSEETVPVESSTEPVESQTEPAESETEPVSGTETGKECNHVYDTKIIEPTCGVKGYTEHVCTVCGDTFVSDYVDALGHVYGEWAVVKAAACEKEGSEERVCSRCGGKETRTVAALSHSYGEWTVSKAATCSSSGEEVQKCTKCGKSKTRTVPAGDHKWSKGTVVHNDSNCADEQVVECTVCGKKCVQIVGWSHTFKNTSNMYVQRESCTKCGLTVTNYHRQFENLFSSQDETAALFTDKIHFKNNPQTVRADWSPLWKGFERAVKESAGRYCFSNHGEDYAMSYVATSAEVEAMSEEELFAEYDKFRKAFKELYGWTPADVEFSDTGYEFFAESNTRDMFKAFKNGVSGLSDARKKEITETLINELLYDSGLYEGMMLYNAVGRLYEVISENVQYDWTLSYHTAFQGLCCGACVCDGYSEIFQRCCDLAGIKCKTIIGTNRGSGHAWNMVTFSDGTERFVDVTINADDYYRILFPKDYLKEYKW